MFEFVENLWRLNLIVWDGVQRRGQIEAFDVVETLEIGSNRRRCQHVLVDLFVELLHDLGLFGVLGAQLVFAHGHGSFVERVDELVHELFHLFLQVLIS